MDPNLFRDIEKRTGIDMRKVTKLAKSLNSNTLRDEYMLRDVIKQVGSIAGKRPSRQTQKKIANMLMQWERNKKG